ncbi:PREDICTED: growth/differentiation factor 9 isoform X2 [Chinchilla lanigera]|nr:PREDICTED: growth/differentiation factor 9 isoform X2 [Chinchilla lanigera]
MKKLYKTYATKEGVPKPTRSHLYNTVRLFTPHSPQKYASGGQVTGAAPSAPLRFSLGRVAAVERLLKSVLLYAASGSPGARCAGSLTASGPRSSGRALPVGARLQLGDDRRGLELDVTQLLQPLVAAGTRSIRLSVNVTCGGGADRAVRAPPSLLLYLNDTSAQAHRRPRFRAARSPRRPGLHRAAAACAPAKSAQRPRRGRDAPGPRLPRPPGAAAFNLSEYLRRFLTPRGECELHDFRLSFRQLRWDSWIVAPQRYNPRYCQGRCPRAVRHRYGSPLHTLVQNVISEKLDAAVPAPSCVPAAYDPLSVLTVEPDASIAYKEYDNMIATRCTCR